MDFNDISFRLKRIYSSINEKFDDDVEKYLNIEEVSAGKFEITFDKGQEESATTNAAIAVLEHLAKLKDHLINRLKARGDEGSIIEEEINNSAALQLVIDIANSEKHGHPLKKERSKKSPRVTNIRHSLVVPPQKQIGINITKGTLIEADGCSINITAEIIDMNGDLLYRWTTLVKDALKIWETVIEKHNIS